MRSQQMFATPQEPECRYLSTSPREEKREFTNLVCIAYDIAKVNRSGIMMMHPSMGPHKKLATCSGKILAPLMCGMFPMRVYGRELGPAA
jgi:hypothetical protein